MTPVLKIRSFTTDQFILDKVFYSNNYRLRGFKENEKKPVVLDLGAHCGYFTFAALSLGAKRVYAFEPFTPNYKMLLENLGGNPIGPVVSYQLGVYVAPVCLTLNYPTLKDKSFFDFANVGIDANVDSLEFCKCCVLPLDTILEHYVGEQVDLMKLSIGYAEMAIINASDRIVTSVSNICGEITLDAVGQDKFKALLVSKKFGYVDFTPITGEDGKIMFHASKADLKETFV